MFPKPAPQLLPNTYAYETTPMVKPTGFREYDARWLFEKEINLMGVQALGLGLGALLREMGVRPELVTGHDFRSYSASIKLALITGLMAAGVKVHDIGLALSPMAYFAQFELDVPAVAMVTASHNDNGWTGVKMGAQRPVTFGPDEMGRLKEIVLSGKFEYADGGSYRFVENFPARYAADLTDRPKLTRKLKVVAACGNGTAGAFAPQILETLGCEVIPLDCELDFTFPRYNPNPEDLEMLHAMAAKVRETGADVALGFDGDGDRCGVVDNEGDEIFADKIGVMLARDLSKLYPDATFVVDVKSTGLFATDPELLRAASRPITGRPGTPTSNAGSAISARSRALKNPGISSSMRRSGAAMTMACSPPSTCSTCSTAIRASPWPSFTRPCRRPGVRRPCRRIATMKRNMASSRRRCSGFRRCRTGRGAHRAENPRSRHRQRRARDRRGRNLGPRARVLQQAGTRRRRRKPGVGGAHAGDVRGGRRHLAREPGGRRL